MTIDYSAIRCICFDCDSTLSTIEGIDELAERAGCVDDIAPLTTAAMDGRLAIEEVYARRLDILRPDAEALAWLGRRYVETMVPGAVEAVTALRRSGRVVAVVSGGLKAPVAALAAVLGVAPDLVRAVDVHLDADGRYRGFDEASPLTRSDGKARVAAELSRLFGPVALIGDGVTDVAARTGGAVVIGFGGVVRREAVVRGADVFVDGPSLASVTELFAAHA
ncbi:MAG: HAD-IB family phosphatase [Hyphomicrobium sp.]